MTSPTETISIYAVTWNMGDTMPPESLKGLFSIPSEGIPPHNIYVLSVQECSHVPEVDISRGAHVKLLIQQALGNEYVLLKKRSLSSIKMYIFVRCAELDRFSEVYTSREACGVAHIIANKGGVAICLDYNRTSFCFINSHLAAHQEKIEDRNSDYKEIMGGLSLDKDFSVDTFFTHLFWMGDLNYRIDMPRNEVISHIEKQNWEALRHADQLQDQMKAEKTFVNFKEGILDFKPTYRFTRGTSEYNDELGRIPAWCDRILSRSLPSDEARLRQSVYTSIENVYTSDHKPVYSIYTVDTVKDVPRDQKILKTSIHISGLKAVAENTEVPLEHISLHRVAHSLKRKIKKNLRGAVELSTTKEVEISLDVDDSDVDNDFRYLHYLMDSSNFSKGGGVISLTGLVKGGKEIPFCSSVYKDGFIVATLSGRISLNE